MVIAAIVVAAVYGKSLFHDFVYDDFWTIVRNPSLTSVNPARFLFDRRTAAAPESGIPGTVYRPLPTWTFALNRRISGLRPWAWRAPDLALHALNGALVFLVLSSVLGFSSAAGALGAAIFLAHPVQTETVVWVTQRSNLLCAAGVFAALWLAARGSPWTTAAFAAALLSKETAVFLLPFLLLALGPQRKKLAARLTLLTAGYLFLRIGAAGGFAQRGWRGSFFENIMVGQAAWLEYVKLLLWPAKLAASHDQYLISPWEHPAPWIGAVLLAAWIGGTVLLWLRGSRRPALGMAWIAAALTPHIGLFPLDTFVAERFLYFPAAGMGVLAAAAWDAGKARRAARLLWVLPAVFAVMSFRRTASWRNDLTLWQSAVAVEPGNSFSRLALAEAFYARGRLTEAAQATREAMTLNPSAPLAFAGLNNLSGMALKEGRPGAALIFAKKALRIQPNSPVARRNRDRAAALR
jgi:tetratricopeptide (TPR) repeat protein